MQKPEWHILTTRPLPEKLIREAAAQHCIIDEISFIETKSAIEAATAARITKLFQKPITAVFTSMNAVTAVAQLFQNPISWKVYSIGDATANLVTQLFQIPIWGSASYADALADTIINDGVKEVYFFCGNIRRDVLPQKLKKANIRVEELVVYETKETPAVVNKEYDAILFYSPSAVHSFFSSNRLRPETILFAIGHTTAAAIKQHTKNKLVIAANTSKEDLVRQMMQHFNTQKREA